MKLIDKDALVAEIKRLHKGHSSKYDRDEATLVLEDLEDFLDTLEVKEVDLENEWVKYFENRGDMATVNIKHLAKHFFELGMSVSNKAQKG